MNVTILWSHWSGYMDACAKALANQGASVQIFHFHGGEAPFDSAKFFSGAVRHMAWNPDADFPWEAEIIRSAPQILLVVSWHIKPYRRVAKKLHGRSVRLLCMDNQWYPTSRQYLGSIAAPVYVKPLYDLAFVPGQRQRNFARRLGFSERSVVDGHLSCDQPVLAGFYPERMKRPINRNFAFVGRLTSSKGIGVLIRAWQMYRQQAVNGWGLTVYGTGPLKEIIRQMPTIRYEDFVQPDELPAKLLQSDVLILPSLFEPWGLVIHEAAAMGMPIICTDACGAGDQFVRDGENGFIVTTGDSVSLCRALLEIASLSEDRVRLMASRSFNLGSQRSPQTWADAILHAAARVQLSLS